MSARAIFFCGDGSPYGRAHLRPILEQFDIAGVVIPTPRRWRIFREALSGEKQRPPGLWTRMRRVWQRRRAGYIDVPAILNASRICWRVTDDANAAEILDWVARLKPDVILSAAYPQIFAGDLLSIPQRGAVNFHPSLLPQFRGAHPHFWAVATGATTSGVSAHFMTPRIDDGDLIAQIGFPIADLTYSQVYAQIIAQTPSLVAKVAEFLGDPAAAAVPQYHAAATFFRSDRDEHRRIRWELQPAEQIRNLCRTERAYCFHRGSRLTLLTATVDRRSATAAGGTVVALAGGGMLVKAADTCVQIREVQVRSKRMAALHWARRAGMRIGEQLN